MSKESELKSRRDWYYRNREQEISKALERNKQRRDKRREWFKEFKSTLKCEKCGENHPAVLDFHHLNPSEKDFSVSRSSDMSKKRVLEEIQKCMVLCSNCHRKLHWEE